MLNNKEVVYGYALAWRHFIGGKKINTLRPIVKSLEEKENYEGCIGVYKAIDEYKVYVDMMKKLKKR